MRYLYSILFMIIGLACVNAQDLAFVLDQEKAGPGDSVRICLSAKNFTDIISMQFTISWDSTVLQYQKADPVQLPGVAPTNFNEDINQSGLLPFVWFNPDGGGSTLEDGTVLFCLYFIAIGELGDSSLLNLRNQPVPVEIGRLDGSTINSIPVELEAGKVEIVDNPLEVDAQITASNCFTPSDGSIQLQHRNGIAPFSYSWTGPDGFSATSKDLDQLAPGTYNLSLTDSLGRQSSLMYQVSGPAATLSATAEANSTDCNSATGSIQVNAQGGTLPYTFDLNGTQNSSGLFNNLNSGDYLILVMDANDCMVDISTTINQQNGGASLDLGPDQQLCPGDSIDLAAPTDLVNYRWFRDNQILGAAGANIQINQAGTFRLEAETPEGCRLSDEVIVSFSTLSVGASGDTEIERGDSTQLNASMGSNHQWTPSSGLSCSNCPDPKAAPENTTTYFVQFETLDGCLAMDSVVIRVTIPEDELRFVPVTFLSPNGDGENDELFFPGLETYQSNDLNIYSRWGQLIYSTVDYQLRGTLWDGTLRGKLVPAGVYYYILRVDEQNITVKRHLTIVY